MLVEGDLCWDLSGYVHRTDITSNPTVDCGLPVWGHPDAWISGNSNANEHTTYIYSYDVFNQLISRLSSSKHFPNMRKVTLFGFSAGAQSVQRFALYPKFQLRESMRVRYVIADPSSFLYFDRKRPYTNGEEKFGVPDSSWLPSQWYFSSSFLLI